MFTLHVFILLGTCLEGTYVQDKLCKNSIDCDDEEYCKDGLCTPCSTVSEECIWRKFCQIGTCLTDNDNSFVPCTDDSNCFAGTVCSSLKICVDPYHPLHNCSAGITCGLYGECRAGKCIPIRNPDINCASDGDCCK